MRVIIRAACGEREGHHRKAVSGEGVLLGFMLAVLSSIFPASLHNRHAACGYIPNFGNQKKLTQPE